MVGLSTTVELNSGVHVIFGASVTNERMDNVNNRSLINTAWYAARGSASAFSNTANNTCQPSVSGVGTLGGTTYTLSPTGTVGTHYWDYNQDNYVAHNSDGTGSTGLSLYAAIPSHGSGSNSAGSQALTPIAPAAPVSLVLSNVQATSVHLNFAAGSGYSAPSSYRIDYSTSPTFSTYSSKTTSTGSNDITGLLPGTTYYFRVLAINTSGYAVSGTVSTQTIGGFWVNVAGTWKIAIPYVNVAGTWKQAVPYVNVAGTWKVTG